MASLRHLSAEIDSQLDAQSIDTAAEIKTLREGVRFRAGPMKMALDALAVTTGKLWFSRRRVRSEALRLQREGKL